MSNQRNNENKNKPDPKLLREIVGETEPPERLLDSRKRKREKGKDEEDDKSRKYLKG